MKHTFHHHFDTFDMKIDSVIAICKNNFKYEENQPKKGDLISFREKGDYYQTFIVEEHHKINDESYKLTMKKVNV